MKNGQNGDGALSDRYPRWIPASPAVAQGSVPILTDTYRQPKVTS
jgi:hypothetical protein